MRLTYQVPEPIGIKELPKTLVELLDFHRTSRLYTYKKVNKKAWSNSARQAYSKRAYLYNKMVQHSATTGEA
eukprot:14474497-Ditylum_brightwellii.AAC.1